MDLAERDVFRIGNYLGFCKRYHSVSLLQGFDYFIQHLTIPRPAPYAI